MDDSRRDFPRIRNSRKKVQKGLDTTERCRRAKNQKDNCKNRTDKHPQVPGSFQPKKKNEHRKRNQKP